MSPSAVPTHGREIAVRLVGFCGGSRIVLAHGEAAVGVNFTQACLEQVDHAFCPPCDLRNYDNGLLALAGKPDLQADMCNDSGKPLAFARRVGRFEQ